MTENTEKTLKTVSIILFVMVVVILGYYVADRFVLDVNLGNMPMRGRTTSQFENYTATTSPAPEGAFYVRLEGVYGSVPIVRRTDRPTYYTLDVTIETKSQILADRIRADRSHAVMTIRDVMSNFRRSDVESERGREFLKEEIGNAIAKAYGGEDIKGIYIEKLFYEEK